LLAHGKNGKCHVGERFAFAFTNNEQRATNNVFGPLKPRN